jgi:hypothetical protein
LILREVRLRALIVGIEKSRSHTILFGVSLVGVVILVTLNLIMMIMAYDNPDKFTNPFFIFFVFSWCIIILWFLLALCIRYSQNTGRPYKSSIDQINLKYLRMVFLGWTLSFALRIAFYIYEILTGHTEMSIQYLVISFFVSLISDIFPFSTILTKRFLIFF